MAAGEKKAAVDLWTGESRRGVRVQLFARLQRPIKTHAPLQCPVDALWGGGHTCVRAHMLQCLRTDRRV